MQERVAHADRNILAELCTSNQGYKDLASMVERFGNRFGGSPREKEAVRFLEGKFREYGLENVHTEEFMYNAWFRANATLEVLCETPAQLKCISLPYTVTADVEGEFVYVGHGTPDEFEALGDIQGKVVMCSARSPAYYPRTVHRAEKIGRAIEGGAVGFIWMRWEPGLLEETGAARWGKPVEIPCVGVSREVGESLNRMRTKGPVRVRITTTDTVETRPTWNVVAEVAGRTNPEKVIILGAHFDGHDIAQGALDDGAGAIVVMEAARALARNKDAIGKTVRFILFPIEEIALGGSYAYTAQHADELDNVEFMLNLDGAGRAPLTAPGITLQGKWVELFGFFKSIGRSMGQPIQVAHGISMYSDHFPFLLKGIPAGTISEFGDARPGVRGWGHSAADTLDKVSPAFLEAGAAFVARLALHMSNREDWPGKRKTEREAQAPLQHEYLEVLRLEKRWPFAEWVPPLVR